MGAFCFLGGAKMVGSLEKRKAGRPKKATVSGDAIRAKLLESLDGVLEGCVNAAKEGSCPHFKLICELLEDGDRKTQKDPARVLLEQWRREQRLKQETWDPGPRMRGLDGRFGSKKPSTEVYGDEQKGVEER